jgi:hypothetical protein
MKPDMQHLSVRGPIISLVSSALLRINDDDQLINSWKKRIDSNVKIKSHYEWKYWLTLHANWTELNFRFNWIGLTLNWIEFKYFKWNSNPIQFNSIIGLRFNWIVFQFNFLKMEKILIFLIMNMMLRKKKHTEKIQIRNNTIWEWAKQIPMWNYPNDNHNPWNLNFFYLN